MPGIFERIEAAVSHWIDHASELKEMTPEAKRKWDEEHKFENTYHSANLIAGNCSSPSLNQVKELLKQARSLTRIGKVATAFPDYQRFFREAGQRLEELNNKLRDLTEFAGLAIAACQISDAVAVLNVWATQTRSPSVSDEDAAKAFEQLFGGIAEYVNKLPAPLNAYAKIFSAISENSFFARFRQLENPYIDPKSPRYESMKRAMSE